MKETITALWREMKRRGIFAFVGVNSIKQTALSENCGRDFVRRVFNTSCKEN